MNSKPLTVQVRGNPLSAAESHDRARILSRNRAIGIAVVLAHVIGLYVALHSSSTALKLESGRPANPVQVSLVAAPVPYPAVQPVAKLVLPVVKPVQQKPEKTKVMSSQAPSERTVQVQPEKTKPAETRPQPIPVPQAAPVAAQATPAAAPAPTQNLLSEPKEISAGELKQLGCQIPQPEYPAKAKRLGQAGTVTVALTVGVDGAVHAAHVAQSSGYESLDMAALTAIRSGHCHLYTADGMPRSVNATQPIAFNLDD